MSKKTKGPKQDSTSDTRRVNLVTNPSLPKQVLPFHSFINCFWFIPINNTDADLAASYASLIFILFVESP
jgi:hypothetical protein